MTKDGELRGEKNMASLFTNPSRSTPDIMRFYRRFSLAQLHHVTAVKLFKEKKETAFHECRSEVGKYDSKEDEV